MGPVEAVLSRVAHHQYQGEGTRLCGQACVAMALGVSLEDSIRLIGHSHGTRTKELTAALGLPGEMCRRLPLTDFCIARVRSGENASFHWVLVDGFTIHDPVFDDGVDVAVWSRVVEWCGARVTSRIDLSAMLGR